MLIYIYITLKNVELRYKLNIYKADCREVTIYAV